MTIGVVIADDDDGVREALASALAADERFDVLARAGDGYAAVDAVRRHRPDAVLLDVRMPGGGAEAAAAIHSLDFPVTIMIVASRVDSASVTALLRVGVRGIFLKGRIGGFLGELVARCCAGEVLLITPSAAEGVRRFGVG